MKKNVKNYVKKAVKSYMTNMYSVYKPCFEMGINPILNAWYWASTQFYLRNINNQITSTLVFKTWVEDFFIRLI